MDNMLSLGTQNLQDESFTQQFNNMLRNNIKPEDRDYRYDLLMLSYQDWKPQIIETSPPWDVQSVSYHYKHMTGSMRGPSIKDKYVLSTRELHDLSSVIAQIVDPELCILYLWTTNGMERVSYDLAEHWGFCYYGIRYTWVKNLSNRGLGSLARHDNESCLMFTYGGQKIRPHDIKGMWAYDRHIHSTVFYETKGMLPTGADKPDYIRHTAEEEHTYRFEKTKEFNPDVPPEPKMWKPVEYLTRRLRLFGENIDHPGWLTITNRPPVETKRRRNGVTKTRRSNPENESAFCRQDRHHHPKDSERDDADA